MKNPRKLRHNVDFILLVRIVIIKFFLSKESSTKQINSTTKPNFPLNFLLTFVSLYQSIRKVYSNEYSTSRLYFVSGRRTSGGVWWASECWPRCLWKLNSLSDLKLRSPTNLCRSCICVSKARFLLFVFECEGMLPELVVVREKKQQDFNFQYNFAYCLI